MWALHETAEMKAPGRESGDKGAVMSPGRPLNVI